MENRDNYLERRDEAIRYIKELSNSIKSFKEIKSTVLGMSIRSSYSQIAFLNLRLDEIESAKKYFFKGAKITAEAFKIFRENRYPNLKKIGELPFNSLFVKSFPDVIVCDSESLLKEYATVIYEEGSPSTGLQFNSDITHALKYLILEDFAKANEYASCAHQPQNLKFPYQGFSQVVKGILDKDIELVNEGIQLRLKHHIKDTKNTIYDKVSIEATALAKLAIRFGLHPDISSPFIHKGLLERQENINYEEVNEILDALAEADRKAGGLLKRISAWISK